MYLYLGYLFIQFFWLVDKLYQSKLAPPVAIFSIIVVFLWSLIPFSGYLLTKLFKLGGSLPKPTLFISGVTVALFENALFYFQLLSKEQSVLAVMLVFILFIGIGVTGKKQCLV